LTKRKPRREGRRREGASRPGGKDIRRVSRTERLQQPAYGGKGKNPFPEKGSRRPRSQGRSDCFPRGGREEGDNTLGSWEREKSRDREIHTKGVKELRSRTPSYAGRGGDSRKRRRERPHIPGKVRHPPPQNNSCEGDVFLIIRGGGGKRGKDAIEYFRRGGKKFDPRPVGCKQRPQAGKGKKGRKRGTTSDSREKESGPSKSGGRLGGGGLALLPPGGRGKRGKREKGLSARAFAGRVRNLCGRCSSPEKERK